VEGAARLRAKSGEIFLLLDNTSLPASAIVDALTWLSLNYVAKENGERCGGSAGGL
jgi:hypothetical protein